MTPEVMWSRFIEALAQESLDKNGEPQAPVNFIGSVEKYRKIFVEANTPKPNQVGEWIYKPFGGWRKRDLPPAGTAFQYMWQDNGRIYPLTASLCDATPQTYNLVDAYTRFYPAMTAYRVVTTDVY